MKSLLILASRIVLQHYNNLQLLDYYVKKNIYLSLLNDRRVVESLYNILSESDMSQLDDIIIDFMFSDEQFIKLPITLNKHQRQYIHIRCSQLKLKSKSNNIWEQHRELQIHKSQFH
jgi:hypothetical protein